MIKVNSTQALRICFFNLFTTELVSDWRFSLYVYAYDWHSKRPDMVGLCHARYLFHIELFVLIQFSTLSKCVQRFFYIFRFIQFGLFVNWIGGWKKLYIHQWKHFEIIKPSTVTNLVVFFFIWNFNFTIYYLIVCIGRLNICISFFRSLTSSRTISWSVPKKFNGGRRTKCNIVVSNKPTSVLLPVSKWRTKWKKTHTHTRASPVWFNLSENVVYKQKKGQNVFRIIYA